MAAGGIANKGCPLLLKHHICCFFFPIEKGFIESWSCSGRCGSSKQEKMNFLHFLCGGVLRSWDQCGVWGQGSWHPRAVPCDLVGCKACDVSMHRRDAHLVHMEICYLQNSSVQAVLGKPTAGRGQGCPVMCRCPVCAPCQSRCAEHRPGCLAACSGWSSLCTSFLPGRDRVGTGLGW